MTAIIEPVLHRAHDRPQRLKFEVAFGTATRGETRCWTTWTRSPSSRNLPLEHRKKIETWKETIREGQVPDDYQWHVARLSSVDSTPVDQTAVRNARRRICGNQLRQIEVAKQSWAVNKDKPEDAAPAIGDLAGYLPSGKLPKCPDGDSYVIGKVSENPRCSVAGHELLQRPK